MTYVDHGRRHLPGGTDPIPVASGSGLQYDTAPQSGNWFFGEATGDGGVGPNGWAWEWVDTNSNGFHVNTGFFSVGGDSPGQTEFRISGVGVFYQLTGSQHFQLRGVGTPFQTDISAGADRVGFFDVTPVPQQVAPTTLADVIAVLQAFGLTL